MRLGLRLYSSWKFLPNRDRLIFKNQWEAFRELCRVTGATLLFNIGFAVFIVEFAFPTPDIVYDIKRATSPDFDLFCRYGEKGEFRMELSNQLRMFKKEQERMEHRQAYQQPVEARFGGAA